MAAKKKQESCETHPGKPEEIVDDLESGDLELEAALARYQEGVKRLKNCYELLTQAEQQVKKLVGESGEEPFADEEGEQ
ncbi:MAG: exodeoxyribonuclease VII small subunit [Planctomycetota bacterium]|jgi:exodeoxyribonuclease VII small subunit